MEITYSKFPLLFYLSYDKESAPDELPFEVVSTEVRYYLGNAKGFHDLFAYIAVKNTLEKEKRITHNNYSISDSLFHKIDRDECFRATEFLKVFKEYIKPSTGTIIFKDGGQYVYWLLGVQETKVLKGENGQYIAIAFFKENLFIGFEEAIVTNNDLQIMKTGHYSDNMDIGSHLSFVLIFLGYLHQKTAFPLLSNEKNKTSEIIYYVE